MSSLWTPGGEVPIDRSRPEDAPPPSGPADGAHDHEPSEADLAAQLEAVRAQVLSVPAAQVVAQHVMAFYELAALHLSEPRPQLQEARLAIDAVEAVLERLAGRLGDAEAAIAGALPQLKMAFVEASDRARAGDGAAG